MPPIHRPFRALRPLLVWAMLSVVPIAGDAQRGHPPVEPQLRRVDLAGDWKYLPYNGERSYAAADVDDREWPTMRLPSSWFLLGSAAYPRHADRALPAAAPGDIWAVDAARGLDWNGTVWFRRSVQWDGDGRRPAVLELDMVDYYAEAFVNGVSVGRHEGYFQQWAVDVTRQLRRGENVVAVRVSAPLLPFDMSYRWPVSWPKQQDQVKGIFLYHDTRPGATSSRGQERSTGGILRGITFRESAGVDVTDLAVYTLSAADSAARLAVDFGVRNWTGRAVSVVLRGEIVPGNFGGGARVPVEVRVRAAPGDSRGRAEVRVARPALWWTWDQGRPNLYRLDAALLRDGGREVLDRRRQAFGIRTISRDSAWVWRLNGRRVFVRGSNYIATQWLSQADRAWYERDVQLMAGANLNAVRVHAHLERPEFYDVADSAGIMVWQDFPLQWGYTDAPSFRAEALRQAAEMIRRFGAHPSIVLWCMHNESPHAQPWMHKKDPRQNLELDDSLAALAARLDPTRITHRDSGTGDAHPYPGWYYGTVADFTGKTDPFVTEYGAQALPGLESLREMFPGDTLYPRNAEQWQAWEFHDFQPDPTFAPGRVERGRTVDEMVASSQRYQAQVVRYGTEVFRRRKWSGITGLYHFMLVEDWPSVTWAVVDYERRAKPGYDALRLAMQPVLPSIEYRIGDRDAPLSLWIVSDLPAAIPGARLSWRVVSADGSAGPTATLSLDVAADTAFRAAPLPALPDVTRGGSTLQAWIEDGDGHVLGRNTLTARDFR
jgi:beta-mannosidase